MKLRFAMVVVLMAGVLTSAGQVSADGDWSIVQSPNASETRHQFLNDVSCLSASDCWGVGYLRTESNSAYQPLFQRWDGASWTMVPAPDRSATHDDFIQGVACATASDCWAVGYSWSREDNVYHAVILGWDGDAWTVAVSDSAVGENSFLIGVTCSSSSECWAVGHQQVGALGGGFGPSQTLVKRWDGSSWTTVTSANTGPTQANVLARVSCSNVSDCWAVGRHSNGSASQTLTSHWDGTAWSIVASPNTSPVRENLLNGVTCVSASNCWAVGFHATDTASHQTLVERWDGTSWTIVDSPNNSDVRTNLFFDVSCVTASDCWAVGYHKPANTLQTVIARWDGISWDILASPNTSTGQTNSLFAVSCGPFGCWSVGNYYNAQSISRTLTVRHVASTPPPPVAPVTLDDLPDFLNAAGQEALSVSGTKDAASSVTVTVSDGITSVVSPQLAQATTVFGALLDVSTLADGVITVTADSTDPEGNVSSVADSLTKDTLAPATTVEAITDPIGDTNQDNVRVSGTTESGATVTVSVSDGTTTTPSVDAEVTGTTWAAPPIDVTQLANGLVTVTAVAVDAAGNRSSATGSSTKDSRALAPAIDISDDGFGYVGPEQSPEALQVSVTNRGPEPAAKVSVKLTDSAGTELDLGSPTLAMGETRVFEVDTTPLADGPLTGRASVGSAVTTDIVTLDRGAPTVAIDDPGVKLSVPFLFSARFTGSASDQTSPIRSVIVTLSQGGTVVDRQFARRHSYSADTTWEYTFGQFLSPGSYTISARSIDEAGNVSQETSRSVTIV